MTKFTRLLSTQQRLFNPKKTVFQEDTSLFPDYHWYYKKNLIKGPAALF